MADHARWSWLVCAAILLVAGLVIAAGGSWLLAALTAVGLSISLWSFFVPLSYELTSLGFRRAAFGRIRSVPWHTVRAYHRRTTGVVLYQQFEPTKMDLLRSIFLPYPADEDEMICTLRQYLPHAVELPA